MRGEVIAKETHEAAGIISGSDGQPYTFRQGNVRNGASLQVGDPVDFIAMGSEARDIYMVRPEAALEAPPAAPMPPQGQPADALSGGAPPSAALPAQAAYAQPQSSYAKYGPPPYSRAGEERLSLWAYFVRCLSTHYAEFNGRARRAEYWGYSLFWWIITLVFMIIDGTILGLTSGSIEQSGIIWFFWLTILWHLATLVPNIAVVVRRLHDLDMSGWLYFLKLLDVVFVSIGSIIIFVFTLMDSKPGRNQYGISPKYPLGEGQVGTFD